MRSRLPCGSSEKIGVELEPFDALLARAPDVLATGVTAAREAGCTSWWLALHARFPANHVIFAELSRMSDELTLSERLALLERLNVSAGAPQEEGRVSLRLDLISALWQAGLIPEGFAVFDAMPDADREWILNDRPLPGRILLDGTPLEVGHRDRGQPFAERRDDFRLDYVAALYLAGRTREARTTFETLPYTAELRPLWDCIGSGVRFIRAQQEEPCAGAASELEWRWGLLESALNRPDEDPYPLAEAGLSAAFGARSIDHRSALWIEATRRRMAGSNYELLRRSLAESWVQYNRVRRTPALTALLTRFTKEEFRRAAAGYESKIQSVLAQWNVTAEDESDGRQRQRVTPVPLPTGSRELSMPENLRTKRSGKEEPKKWPAGITPLPEGFLPVRFERGRQFAVAVSLSQNLDPVGEISNGGYWIHVSRDRGASWDEPLYTGLSQYFPYIVPPDSKMPLWAEDRITMEVEIQELDPSSITYPPVALRSRRRASNLYLEIPLATLRSDRDFDGLSDIVEDRLLLHADNSDSDGDGLSDGLDPLPNVNNSGSQRNGRDPIARVLQFIFNTPSEPIVEPVDRDPGPDVLFQGKVGEKPGALRPLFVRGRPEDFSAFGTGFQILVYSNADIERLLARSLDFHALSLEPVVFNRAGDRGYAVWSMGWTGGTLRLIREGEFWRIEVISHWIT